MKLSYVKMCYAVFCYSGVKEQRQNFFLACTGASLVIQTVKNLSAMQETQVQSLGHEDPLEKGMATHSSILAWRIPRTEQLDGVISLMGSPRGRKESDMTERLTQEWL